MAAPASHRPFPLSAPLDAPARYGHRMVRAVVRPILPTSVARAAVEATKDDPLLYAASSLMLLAGLRCGEATSLLVRDWSRGKDPKLTVRGLRMPEGRTIRVAPSAATAIDAYLAGEEAEPDEPLLIGLRPNGIPHFLPKVFRDAMRRAGLDVSVHDLRRAAEAAVLEDGTPVAHVAAYFGMSKAADEQLTLVPDGYNRGIAVVLERTFAA